MIMQVNEELEFDVPEVQVEWLKMEILRLMGLRGCAQGAAAGGYGVGSNWDQSY
jgi:DNA polymerase-1